MADRYAEHPHHPPRLPHQKRNPFLFLSAMLVCLFVFEMLARTYASSYGNFWYRVEAASYQHPINIVFMGSSRTAASINPEYLQAMLSKPGNPVYVHNAGTGYTTPAEYYLAFRNSLNENPGAFENCTVVMEAPGEMPIPQAWTEQWGMAEAPDYVTPHLRVEDMGPNWRTGHSLEEKLDITANWFFHNSTLYADRRNLGADFFHTIERPIVNTLEPPTPQAAADLTNTGGIRIDPQGVALARKVAYGYVDFSIATEHSTDWEHTVVGDLVRLAHAHHVKVVFFAPPLHPLFRSIYETTTREVDRQTFLSIAPGWGTVLVIPRIPLTDEDFPDLWHLRHSRTNEFTQAFLEEWRRVDPEAR